jgi:general secretion pathway protein N
MKWFKRGALALLVLLVLAAILLATAPADLVYRLFASRLGPIRAEGLSGTVWNGSATALSAFDTPLGKLQWRLDPWLSLRGRPAGTLSIEGSEVRGESRVGTEGGTVRLHDLKAEFPARLLGPALDIPALVMLGRVAVDVPEAVLTDGILRQARGVATWRDLGVSGAAEARLDGVEIGFAPSDAQTIRATVRDLGGALAIDGTVVLRDGRFHAEVRLAAREANPNIEEALKFIGQLTPDGASLLIVDGQLYPLW